MNYIFSNKKRLFIILASLVIFLTSIALGLHNATLYNPSHGFDGIDHVFYIKYVSQNKKIPPPNLGKETHQSPLYYIIGATFMSFTGTWKTAQYINTFVLWLIILMVGLGLRKVFKKRDQVLIGMFSLAALPMLNIFPAMITNELMSTFWIVSAAVSMVHLISANNSKQVFLYLLWFTLSFIIGYWTKVSIITILPVVLLAIVICFVQNKNKINRKLIITFSVIAFLAITLLSVPIFFRAKNDNSSSNIIIHAFTQKYRLASLNYYFRLDWIPKVDMYNTQYYSLIGGAWNSFWTDGHNAVTPFIKFHKKSFVLWSLGFILLPLCLYGLKNLGKKDKKVSFVVNTVGITMILTYIYMNFGQGHYSGVRLTYEMGIVVPYAFGLAAASMNKKLKTFILILLFIQFVTMVSFYWIQPWWHVTK